jgi:hypothetical protein
VDFASGAGGPTPDIEREVNQRIQKQRQRRRPGEGEGDGEGAGALFVLTDLRPHIEAWEATGKRSGNLRFVPQGVDAADAPRDLVERVTGGSPEGEKKKVMRLFSLAFHHFDDELAERILRNTIACGDGFG